MTNALLGQLNSADRKVMTDPNASPTALNALPTASAALSGSVKIQKAARAIKIQMINFLGMTCLSGLHFIQYGQALP